MARLFFATTLVALSVSGCANLTSISRTTDATMPGGEGTAIHLDAQQRLVYSDARALCAEPSPDAMTAIASSFGGGLSAPGQGAASVAAALQQSAASIGLRTQSITLMRDQLYRICEAYHNNALNDADVANLLERSQDLTLAVLSVEQLTGAVAAQQAVLGGGANSRASANLVETAAALKAARLQEKQAKDALERATTARDLQKKTVETKQAAYDAATEAAAKDKAKNELESAKSELVADEKAVADADAEYKVAQENTKAIEENLDAATTSASAAAYGSGSFGSARGGGLTLDKDSVKAVSDAVDRIVGRVVNKSHLTNACINLMSRPESFANPTNAEPLKRALDLCDKVIATYLAAYSTVVVRPPSGNDPTQPPPPAAPAVAPAHRR